jgi:hypothetical protein
MGVKLGLKMLREEHRLGVYENLLVNEIFGFKWKKVKRGLHNEGLYDLYFSRNSSRVMKYRMRWASSMIRVRKYRKARRNVVGKSDGQRQLAKK